VSEVAPEGVGDPEPRLDHPGDVGRRLAHLLDRIGDPQHARHSLGVLGAPRREHRDLPEAAQVRVHALVEAFDLPGELLVVEEHSRVREVDHQLGGVLQLDEQVLDALRLVIHGSSLRILP
jgi:hypothetical protein